MEVKIPKTFQVKEPIQTVWKLLSNPPRVVVCVPGAKITEVVDERTYKGAISVKVGPTVTDYRGEVRIETLDNDAHKIAMVGKGQDTRGKGSATMKMTGELQSLPDGGTEVTTLSEVSVVGVLAQFGGRMIQEVSNKIFAEFTKSFQQELEKEAESERAAQASDSSKPPPPAGTGTAESAEAQTTPSGSAGRGAAVAGPPSTGAGESVGAPSSGPAAVKPPQQESASRQAPVTPSEPKPINAVSLIFSVAWSSLVNFFRRLFGRSETS
jgi:carbon monoxide dehydrogenase subunit G